MKLHRPSLPTRVLAAGVAALLLLVLASASLAEPIAPASLPEPFLWNKLGSPDEIRNSEIGAGFELREDQGDVLFSQDAMFGGALRTTGGTANTGPVGGYLEMSPDDFFPADRTRGTVEFWVQKQVERLIPYQSPLVTFFGHIWYGPGLQMIAFYWDDMDKNPLSAYILTSPTSAILARDYGWGAVPTGQWVHVAMVWDGAGIDGSADDLRIYRDGVLTASHQGRFDLVYDQRCNFGYQGGPDYCRIPAARAVKVLGNHEGRRLRGCQTPSGYCPAAAMDNLVVWDYAKTDFSGRWEETPIPVTPVLCQGQPTTLRGSAGHDVLVGTANADVIAGLGGNDTISGGAGDDLICGGDGNDTLAGGPGNDVLAGDAGHDALAAGGGDDRLEGGAGNDTLFGREGSDVLNGGDGNDTLMGRGGLDTLDGGSGNDTCTDAAGTPMQRCERRLIESSQVDE